MNLRRYRVVIAGLLILGLSTLVGQPAVAGAPPAGGPCGVVGTGVSYPDMVAELNRIAARSHGRVTTHSAGTSVQGRDLVYAKVGSGPVKYFVWGRIHGNETIGTRALLNVLDTLSRNSSTARRIRSELTLVVIPIWNVDGAELGQREGAPIPGFPEGQDLNRDWISPLDPRPVPSGSTSFLYPESRDWYDLYATERPNFVQDIHQFSNSPSEDVEVLPGTTDVVEIQIGTAHEVEHNNPAQLLASQRLGQTALDAVKGVHGAHPARFDLGSAAGTAPRSALRRMIADGLGYAGSTLAPHVPDGGFFFELRNATNARYLSGLVERGTMAVLDTLARGDLGGVDPAEFNALPNPEEASCADV